MEKIINKNYYHEGSPARAGMVPAPTSRLSYDMGLPARAGMVPGASRSTFEVFSNRRDREYFSLASRKMGLKRDKVPPNRRCRALNRHGERCGRAAMDEQALAETSRRQGCN